jgi:hypothetical protein
MSNSYLPIKSKNTKNAYRNQTISFKSSYYFQFIIDIVNLEIFKFLKHKDKK